MTKEKTAPATKTVKNAASPAPKSSTKRAAPKATPKDQAPSPLVGKKAPAFALVADDGATVTPASFRGRWLVLFFYPKDSTPGCTREACAFEAARPALARRGVVVVGVSRDSTKSHVSFKAKQRLGFALLSDPDASVHAAYGAWGEKLFYGKKITGALRTTVIVDPAGAVARVFSLVKVDGHDAEVLAALDELGAR